MKISTLLVLYLICFSSCATLPEPTTNTFQLPKGYEIIEVREKVFKIKDISGNIVGPEWLTEDGAIGYAIFYDSVYATR